MELVRLVGELPRQEQLVTGTGKVYFLVRGLSTLVGDPRLTEEQKLFLGQMAGAIVTEYRAGPTSRDVLYFAREEDLARAWELLCATERGGVTKMRVYRGKDGHILGIRCGVGHGGNRRYYADSLSAECGGCLHVIPLSALPRFRSRAEAEAVDRQFVAEWPWDPAGDVLAGKHI